MEVTAPSTSKASKVQAVLDLATHLVRWSNSSSRDSSITFPDPTICFHSLPLRRKDVSPNERIALHEVGVQLWNACCGLSRDTAEPHTQKLVAQARAFAYFVLESASSATSRSPVARGAARNAVRVAKECLAYDLIDLANKIIEHLAEHKTRPEDADGAAAVPSDNEQYQLEADFLLLRIALAWKQKRLDMADHFHAQLKRLSSTPKKPWTLSVADLDFEIGTSLLHAAQPDAAAVWLRRAADAIEEMDPGDSQVDTSELSLNIRHTLVRTLLVTNEPETGQEALQKFKILKQAHGHRLPVMLLELELLAKDPAPNPDAYFTALSKIVCSVHIFEGSHRLIMHYIHHLKTFSLAHALQALKHYIVQRLSAEDDRSRIQSAIVSLIWMALSASESAYAGPTLHQDLEDIYSAWKQCLEAEAAHAAVLHIKRLTESNEADAVHWCQAGLHRLLGNIGEQNIGKLQRKLITCHIKAGNLQAANDVFMQQSESARRNSLSNYLGYVIALRAQDASAADAAIAAVMNDSRDDHQLLLACISETVKHGSQRRGAFLMQRILDKFNYELPSDIDTCALLRCTARLHISVLCEGVADDLKLMLMLCSVFRAAAAYTSKSNGGESAGASPPCPIEECKWFEKTSFNLALQYAEKWPAKIVIDLLAHSSTVVYPRDASTELKSVQVWHTINAKFLQAIVFATQARAWSESNTLEDIPRSSYHARTPPDATRLQCHLYQNIIDRYFALQPALGRDLDVPQIDATEADITSKTVTLLPLAFEAHLFTTLSDTLSGIPIDELSLTKLIDDIPHLTASSKPYALLADLILSSATPDTAQGRDMVHMPTRLPIRHATTLIGRLIAVMRSQDDYDVVKAARWIRCVAQMVLDFHTDDNSGDDRLALITSITTEAVNLARTSSSSRTPPAHDSTNTTDTDSQQLSTSYPTDELQWLATVLFNRAVDLYVAGNTGIDVAANPAEAPNSPIRWAERAVAVADALGQMAPTEHGSGGGGDGGRLARVLRQNGARVGWTL